ncbi:MAG TPA: methylglyoxal synthase [Cytophagales bacterium]|nr:methylglyoxal synthase [Cytophagales bacterium]
MIKRLAAKKRIGLIAHDHKKVELIEWAMKNKKLLENHELFGTGTTGRLIEEALNLPVNKLLSGPLGGDQQIGSKVAEGKIDVIIFFWDPMEAQPHDPDIKALLRIGVVWNIPMACNESTADFILNSIFMTQDYDSIVPDYNNYIKRKI